VNASCLLLTILAANHAAARSDTSLPYLAQTAPETLRFAARRILGPPPIRPGTNTISMEPTLGHESASSTDTTPAALVTSTTTTSDHDPVLPGFFSTPAQPATPPPPYGVALVPDIYAPLPPPVTIEDLLPFFIPPPAPAAPPSRATYELK